MENPAIAPAGGTGAPSSELGNLWNSMIEGLRAQENDIRSGIAEGLRPNGDLMGVPDHIRDQIKTWEEAFTSTQDRKLVQELKAKIYEIHASRDAYVASQVESKTERFHLELAMKAASKTTSGIQQLLSAQ